MIQGGPYCYEDHLGELFGPMVFHGHGRDRLGTSAAATTPRQGGSCSTNVCHASLGNTMDHVRRPNSTTYLVQFKPRDAIDFHPLDNARRGLNDYSSCTHNHLPFYMYIQ
ncbi:uncharacterized protein LOC123987828 [Osmia bicornis bicornis]|uniref:uncharacterized protein LOC123987828 n=1 Tax=Osmia bicornis bicornis TaxID=1437191 RepID=UPI001EAF4160|nr:uncharacterized protein LOC123987828 [Osmia bicornis bicornis]